MMAIADVDVTLWEFFVAVLGPICEEKRLTSLISLPRLGDLPAGTATLDSAAMDDNTCSFVEVGRC